jgi:branched-chain amino acid transport system ATP-binding protein
VHLLEVDAIDVFYGQVQALRGLTLHVDSGEMVALVGANGAGKSTTLRTVSGLLSPRRGSIHFEGRPIHGMPAYDVVQHGITHLPEGRDLFPSLSVVENLRMGYWARRRDRAGLHDALDRAMDLFPRLRERASQAAGTMSGGEQQMLGIARALMPAPRMVIVDELSLGLAPMIVEQLFDVLRAVNREGAAVLLVEQFVHMALANTDRAYVLAKGEVAMQGASSVLRDDPSLVESYLGGAHEAGTPSADMVSRI